MTLPLYQVDAFTSEVFRGNPAAVCPLETWLDDKLMQKIAMENNLSETVFFVKEKEDFHIRWFTPKSEVAMCGHATLAAAHIIFTELGYHDSTILFASKSGQLEVVREQRGYRMDFPAQKIEECDIPSPLLNAFSTLPIACYKAMDYLLVFEDEKDILEANPIMIELEKLDLRGVIITAKSKKYDFVTRFFAPKLGVDEDPVTGSAFTQLAPYWAEKLGKNKLYAKQLSTREGELFCMLQSDRVLMSGKAVTYLKGSIILP